MRHHASHPETQVAAAAATHQTTAVQQSPQGDSSRLHLVRRGFHEVGRGAHRSSSSVPLGFQTDKKRTRRWWCSSRRRVTPPGCTWRASACASACAPLHGRHGDAALGRAHSECAVRHARRIVRAVLCMRSPRWGLFAKHVHAGLVWAGGRDRQLRETCSRQQQLKPARQ